MARTEDVRSSLPSAVTGAMVGVIDRTLAVYSAATLLLVVPVAVALWPYTEPWWLLVFGGGLVGSAAWMIVLALRRRSIARAAGVYAALVPLGYVAQHWGVHQNGITEPGVLSAAVGVAVVCAGVWRGARFAVGYAVVTAVLLVVERMGVRGGDIDLLLAVCEGVFSVGAGLGILEVALGMLQAARAADALDARVRRQELDLAVERAFAAERARLDQVLHDDVMATLTAAARAHGPESVPGVTRLAAATLVTVDDLREGAAAGERVPLGVLRQLVGELCARVSPAIALRDEAGHLALDAQVPVAAAEAGLSAVREALRNAVRHAGATRVEVRVSTPVTTGAAAGLSVRVRDDGRGFDPGAAPAERLGVRVSLGEALDRAGLEHRLVSEVGVGTVFEVAWASEPSAVADPPTTSSGPHLPAEFPVRRLTTVVWAVTLGMVAIGLVLLPRVVEPLSVVGMVLVCLLTALVLRAGATLVLPRWAAGAALGLVAGTSLVMSRAVPSTGDPSVVAWHLFPLQLVLVVLVLRRRRGTALAALAVLVAGNLAWWARGDLPVPLALTVDFGAVTFFVMALLVSAMLGRIARRQEHLRAQERAALDDALRAGVASLQRSMWASDLQGRARDVIGRIAALTAPPSESLVTEALMLEATLREQLVARNVMNEELAALTDSARRSGVEVSIVDSRTSPASSEVARAVNAEVRATLASRPSRLVVRWAPEGMRTAGPGRGPQTAASVVSQSGPDVTLTTIDDAGERETRAAGR